MEHRDVTELREEIDRIDRELIRWLGLRAECALEIGKWKRSQGMVHFDGSRERGVIDGIVGQNDGPFSDDAVRSIFVEIISACRSLQGPTCVAYLGPEGTFSHLAAVQAFGRSCHFEPQESIAKVFREVELGHCQFGIVPVENSTEGAVGLTLDQFATTEVSICGEIYSRISHACLSRETDLSAVTRVYSHPQALAQCMSWLTTNLPGRELVPVSSTAAAAARAASEEGAAAVGSLMLAGLHHIEVLAEDIQDLPRNQTRFLILASRDAPASGRDKTSLLFATSHRPGALRESLTPLAERGINLTRIESRPAKDRAWTYVFFVDIEGHRSDPHVADALSRLIACTAKLKILGSYPVGETVQTSEEKAAGHGWSALRNRESVPELRANG